MTVGASPAKPPIRTVPLPVLEKDTLVMLVKPATMDEAVKSAKMSVELPCAPGPMNIELTVPPADVAVTSVLLPCEL